MQPGRAWGADCREGDLALPGLAPEDPGVPLTPPTSDRSFQDSPTTRGQGTGRQRPDGAGDLGSKTLAGPPGMGGCPVTFLDFCPSFQLAAPAVLSGAHGQGPGARCPHPPLPARPAIRPHGDLGSAPGFPRCSRVPAGAFPGGLDCGPASAGGHALCVDGHAPRCPATPLATGPRPAPLVACFAPSRSAGHQASLA